MTRLARHGALAIIVAALLELGLYLWLARRAPAFEDYAALAEPVKAMRREGELVIGAPGWTEPMLRRALGPEVMPLRDLARPDDSGYPAAIEIASQGARARALGGWRVVASRSVGAFVLRRLENPKPLRTVVDFVEALGPAVEVALDGRACSFSEHAPLESGGLGGHPTFPRRRFSCGGSPFFNVGVTVIADQAFRARRCLWAHPPERGALTVRFPRTKLGSALVGHGGMYWMVERERSGAPVELTASVDGREIGRYIHADGDGWSRFEMPLGPHAGREGAVSFAVSSPDYRHRHFCFEARSVE